MALAAISLSEASARIQARSVTAVELVNACLGRIDVYNPKVNAFITVMREAALAQARTLDAEQRDGKLRGPLHGIPIALKDNIDTAGVRTTAASAVFDDRVPAEDAPVAPDGLFDLGVPMLGICYGHQVMAQSLGGTVENSDVAEYGGATINVTSPGMLFAGLPHEQAVWMSHRDHVSRAPSGFTVTAASAALGALLTLATAASLRRH